MKWTAAAALAAVILTGCGGGGGGATGGNGGNGGNGGGPGPVAPGTFTATASGMPNLQANVTGAFVSGNTLRIYGDQRTGPVNDYTSSRRLTLALVQPAQPGVYTIRATPTSGSASASYIITTRSGSDYFPGGTWQGTSGTVTISKVDNAHVEGSFDLTMTSTSGGGSFTLTGGAFNVSFEAPPPPGEK